MKEGAGHHYTTYFRQYDPRLGRWWSNDPVVQVGASPYEAMYDNPINYADALGNQPDPNKGGSGTDLEGTLGLPDGSLGTSGGTSAGTGGETPENSSGGNSGGGMSGSIFDISKAYARQVMTSDNAASKNSVPPLNLSMGGQTTGGTKGSKGKGYASKGQGSAKMTAPTLSPSSTTTPYNILGLPVSLPNASGTTLATPFGVPIQGESSPGNAVGTPDQFRELAWIGLGFVAASVDNYTLGASTLGRKEPVNAPFGYHLGRVFGDIQSLVGGSAIAGAGLIETGLLGAASGPTFGASLILTPATIAQTAYGFGVVYTSAANLFDDFNAMMSVGESEASNIPPKGGDERAKTYSSGWTTSSLQKAVDKFAPGANGVKNQSGKTIYKNDETGVQVVFDDAGNYFRIENANLTGKRKYLDLDGNIPNNKVVDGRTSGRSQAEYNQVTHFNNSD